MEEEKSDEDRIIEALLVEGRDALYEDIDFLPLRQSLYNSENIIPEYDDEIGQHIQWCRPNKIFEAPVYFNSDIKQLSATIGSLPDESFLGTLMAICAYSKYDLIENIFASKPEDFIHYGIYTCRFYVEGEWVEVLTDTHIPCVKNNLTGKFSPVYGTSYNTNELWVTFVEKAFAKAMGSYEEIPNIKVQKALLHLTGGSVQVVNLVDQVHRQDQRSEGEAWRSFRNKFDDDTLIILTAINTMNRNKTDFEGTGGVEEDGNHEEIAGSVSASQSLLSSTGAAQNTKPKEHLKYFIPDYIYSVVLCREYATHELVLLHNPWKVDGYKWIGEWSDQSNEWDMYPEVLHEIEKDPDIPWRRYQSNGYFWISFRNLLNFFNKTYYCKLFPNEKYHFYCSNGSCRKKQCGGPLQPLRHKDNILKDYSQSKIKANIKATAAEVIDGDSSWFTNPQYRIINPNPGLNRVYISVSPIGSDETAVDQAQNIQLTLTSSSKQPNVPVNLWDVTMFDIVATDHDDSLIERVKGQETSIWRVDLDSKHIYHILPNTMKRKIESDFILRVFSTKPVIMELVIPLPNHSISGVWKKSGDMDTTGGPLKLLQSDGTHKFNAKWCQNPQYHVEIADPYGKEEVYLKIVVKRTDSQQSEKRTTKYGGNHDNSDAKKNIDATVGLLICKADVLDTTTKIKKKPPRQNIMGELLPSKVSSLKNKPGQDEFPSHATTAESTSTPKTILRKLTIDSKLEYYTESTYCSKLDACIFYPKIPRSWIPNGLIVVPSLNDKNIKGAFDLDVYASERIYLNQLPDSYSKTISGEWVENNAGGNHFNPSTWKKNPKYALKILQPMNTLDPVNIRISIARVGTNWKQMARKDTIGCMIGFYIFVSNIHTSDMQLHYESIFIPEDELVTDQSFQLPQLNHGEVFLIMPTTYDVGKLGSFVISVLCEYEFSITKDKEK